MIASHLGRGPETCRCCPRNARQCRSSLGLRATRPAAFIQAFLAMPRSSIHPSTPRIGVPGCA